MAPADFAITIRSDCAVSVTGTLRHANHIDQFISALRVARAALPCDDAEFDSFRAAVRDGTQKVSAIKQCRTLTGLGLKEAKDLVEAIFAGGVPMPTDRGDLMAKSSTFCSGFYPSAAA